jgi:hypothetical protein
MAEMQYETPQDYKSGLADILKEAKNIYEAKKAQGFPTYGGPRIAGFAPEELAAMSGIAGLVGAGQQYFAPAAALTMGQAQQFTPSTAAQYMSPYQQAVVDVEKREAVRQAQRPRQDIAAAAVSQGAFGGSRQAILEAEQQRNLQRQLGDIQTRGQQAAYESGLRAFEAQKARERQAASGLASLGQVAPRQALAELTALSGIGEAQRGMTQAGLDIGYEQFQRQQQYPYDLLGQYQASLYGYPYQAFSQYQPVQRPSSAQNLAGVLGAVGKIAGPSGFGFFKSGGSIAYRSEGGLSGLTKNMQAGTMVGDTMSNASEIEFPGIDTSKDILPQVSKSSVLQAMLETQLGLQDYTQAMKESLAKQSELTQAEKARLQKQTSPIDYISDLLIGFAAADPEAGMGAQAAAAAEYASAQKEAVQDEIAKLERDLAAGNLTQAEAALKLRQLQATTLSDIYEATSPEEIKSSDVNSLRKIAADRLGAMYDPETGILIEATPAQKEAVAELLSKMIKAFRTGGYDAAMAIAVEGQKIGGDEEESETLAEDDDVAAAATKNVLGKIQGLKE